MFRRMLCQKVRERKFKINFYFYYFFHKGLDRFSQMFISPLLAKNAMQRERESVDSEYQMALSSEGKIYFKN